MLSLFKLIRKLYTTQEKSGYCDSIILNSTIINIKLHFDLLWPIFNLWLFGLPCSGKTTLAEKLMDNFSRDRVIHLDGDEIRKTISKDLDFSYESREINIRRVIELCNFLMIGFHQIF